VKGVRSFSGCGGTRVSASTDRAMGRNAANCLVVDPTADVGSHSWGSAVLAAAILLVIDFPPALGAESHCIQPVLIIATDGVIVAVAVGAHLHLGVSIGARAAPLPMSCGLRGAGERCSSHRHSEGDQESFHRRP